MTFLHRFALDAPQPVAKHPGHGDQAVHNPRKGGGAGAAGAGQAVAQEIESATSSYSSNIKDYANKGDFERQEMDDFKTSVGDAASSARAGDFPTARNHLANATSLLNNTPMTGLVNRLMDASRKLPN